MMGDIGERHSPSPRLADGSIADQAYGLGWRFMGDNGEWIGHGGGSVGGNTLMMINPDLQVALAVVCNQSNCLGPGVDWADVIRAFIANGRQTAQ